MNKEFTNEDIINAAKHCATNADCDNCPFFATLEIEGCIETFTRYIVNNTKNEPAPAATGTSSEVSAKEDTDNIQFNDSTKAAICQAYDTVDEACTDIIGIYEGMSEREHRAFDIGEAYGKICSTRDKLENMKGEN